MTIRKRSGRQAQRSEKVRLTGLKAIGEAIDISCPKKVKGVLAGKSIEGVKVLRKQGNSWVVSVEHLRILAARGEI